MCFNVIIIFNYLRMNIFLNTKYIPKLIVNNRYFKCQIGKNGIVPIYKKKEGDGCTPFGKWKLNNIYFRSDKSISLKLDIPIIVNFFLNLFKTSFLFLEFFLL